MITLSKKITPELIQKAMINSDTYKKVLSKRLAELLLDYQLTKDYQNILEE